ncbi:MAG: ABC transporter permease [Longimicrobiales bacterium]
MVGLKLAFRTLRKAPFVSAVAIFSLALGVGANGAIFSLFDQILIQALPVEEPERLVNFRAPGPNPGSQSCGQAGDCKSVFSYPMFRDLEETTTSLSGLAAHREFGTNLATAEQTVSGTGVLVSGSYFSVLGLRPALGRLLTPADDETIGEHFVTVLGYDYWESQLGLDPGVLNSTIIVNGQSMTVVGVAPQGFKGTTLGAEADVYVPLTMRTAMSPWWDAWENRRNYWAYLFARLAPEATVEQARSEMNTVYQRIINEVEAPLQTGMSDQTMEQFRAKELEIEAGPRGQSTMHAEVRTPMVFLFGITAMVLLIACANIANLLLARGANRGSEMAIRASLGAGRTKMLGQLLTESLLLAVLGGLASLLVAQWTLGVIATLLPPETASAFTPALSLGVVTFVGALAIGTGILFGLYPALHSTRTDLVTALKSNAGQPAGHRAAARFRSALVTAQIALSMALLVGAGLFLKSLTNVNRVDLGMNPANVATFTVAPELNGLEREASIALYEQVERELAALPGVSGVSGAIVPILIGDSWGTDVAVTGFESGPDIDSNSRMNMVGAGYFSTLGIPLIGGREFTVADNMESEEVAIVNEAFARKFGLDPRQAVGKFMSDDGGDAELTRRIVGVAQDANYSEVKGNVPPLFFLPYRQNEYVGSMTFYARTQLDPSETIAAVRGVIRAIDPNLPVERLETLVQVAKENVMLDRLITTLSAAFAVLATILAAVGLYGVLAYTVSQRTREIGLRVALGADGSRVRGLVLRQVARMTVIGVIIGLVGAFFLGRAAESLLFGLEGSDPFVMVGVVLTLSVVALSAGYLPARRASRVDPMVALRHE